MKHFQVPQEVVLVKPWAAILAQDPSAKPEPIPFLRWATFMWLDDTRAYMDGQTQSVMRLRRWQKVIDKFEIAAPGEWVSLDDQDYATLRMIVEAPARVFQQNNTMIALACLPYTDAVLDAKDTLPPEVDAP
jgi:hypothetical protein